MIGVVKVATTVIRFFTGLNKAETAEKYFFEQFIRNIIFDYSLLK